MDRAQPLNDVVPQGCRPPRLTSSRVGDAGSLCPIAGGTGGTLVLPYPAHLVALLTHYYYTPRLTTLKIYKNINEMWFQIHIIHPNQKKT